MNATVETPRPSAAETLRAKYGDEWDIWRELLPGGRHGDWLAETRPGVEPHQILRAATVNALTEQLREARS
ncbi:hypothetical protein GCM10022254_10250 [Actinomadura meridiana]|uniref:Uncharacterized protein n=1 Tax=Actinomadura meridiana TaxID=559626 RepID=A0ABP8BTY0_9ACTN